MAKIAEEEAEPMWWITNAEREKVRVQDAALEKARVEDKKTSRGSSTTAKAAQTGLLGAHWPFSAAVT